MRHSLLVALTASFVALASAHIVGCSSTPASTSCVSGHFDGQSTSRFIVGQTFYMPTVANQSECSGLAWKLSSAPSGNTNEIHAGADGYTRFTPALEGTYTFSLGDEAGTVETLQVISADSAPFHNLNYFPGQSIALVNGEIWTADVHATSLSRLDPATLESRGRIDVGSWPVAIAWKEGMTHAVVAQRGNDNLGLVDIERKQIIDAIWVGDEPANVVLSSDGKIAYVALATENAVVKVDIYERKVLGRLDTGVDPRAMALSSDDGTLYVASYRSGQSDRYPHATDPKEEQRDITVIDANAWSVKTTFLEVGGMIQGLVMAPDGSKLYVATTRNNTSGSQTKLEDRSFAHEVVALDPQSGSELAAADLTRQATTGGFAVTLHGLVFAQNKVWVVAESSDLVVALDPNTLEEMSRVTAKGRPRAILAHEDALFVHGAQGMAVTKISKDGQMNLSGKTRPDNRPELVARGQQQFTGAGDGFAQNHACNSCHADGLSDRLSWKIGPSKLWEISRPQFWLEGTDYVGWTGYVSSVRNFSLAGNGTVGVKPTTEIFDGMNAYMSSLMPPPAANGKTNRDGSLSKEALQGKAIFESKGACSSCHAVPLGTNQALLEEGITEGKTDVPSLVGVYRHGIWLKHGDARDLRSAVDIVVKSLGVPNITDGDVDSMTRYVEELTARDFFLLASYPKKNAIAPVDEPIRLTFSYPVFNDPKNLEFIRLSDKSGKRVAADIKGDGRHVIITPNDPLAPSSKYAVSIARDFQSFGELPMYGETTVSFTTAAAPTIRLDGKYTWTVAMPIYNPVDQVFDPSTTIPVTVDLDATKTASGSKLVFAYTDALSFDTGVIIEGAKASIGSTPIPVNNNFADSRDLVATLVDDDGDGIAESAEGTVTITGPGMYFPNMPFSLTRPQGNDCVEGASGMPVISLGTDGNGLPIIDWGADPVIAVYVNSPGAKVPLGPGQTISNGTAYWMLQTASFPMGFSGPITYGTLPAGATDISEANGVPLGGAQLEPGTCYEFNVITTSFAMSKYVKRW